MRIKILALITCFFLTFHISGQNFWNTNQVNADSLKEILPFVTGEDKINALNKLALVSFSKHPDSCKKLAKESISLSLDIDYMEGMAYGYFNLGNALYIQDSLKPAFINFLKAESLFTRIPPSTEEALLYYILSNLHYEAGHIDQSKRYSRKMFDTYQALSKHRNEIMSMNILACRYWYHDWDSAFYYHQQALDLLQLYPYNTEHARTYLFLSLIAIRKADAARFDGDHELSTAWFRKSLDHSTRSLDYFYRSDASWIDSIYLLPAIFINHNVGLWETGNKDSIQLAMDYLHKVIYMSDTGNTLSPEYTLVAYYELARHTKDTGNVDAGLGLYEKGLTESEKQLQELKTAKYMLEDPYFKLTLMSEYRSWLAWAQYWVYRAYENYGDYKNALKHYKAYKEADELIYKEDNDKLIAMLEAESENEKTENRIAGLERDRQMSELRASQSRYFNIGLGIFIIVLLLVSLLFIRQNKIKNEYRNTLLEQKLLRLQMNPHFIFNALSSIHSLMNPKDVGRASIYLGNFSRLLRNTLESSREDYILLEDEISSMRNYLELQSLRFENKFEYTIYVDPGIKLNTAIIPPMLIQPFIENAIEHGIRHKEGRGNIKVKFELEKQKIICEIEDDGVGREKAWEIKYAGRKENKSLATKIIHDRITVLNKKLRQKISLSIIDLRSENKQSLGTMVRLDLPYILD